MSDYNYNYSCNRIWVGVYQVLLRAGAYINKCDKNGCTPIYKAAFHGRPTLIELLARAGEPTIATLIVII